MAVRVVRHLAGRSCNADSAVLLAAIPYGAGERFRHLRWDAYIATQDESPVDQPSEVNWNAIDVPWSILLTSASAAGVGGTGSLDTAAEWDTIFRNLLLEYGTDGNEYYGGDYDAATPDVVEAPGEEPDDIDEPSVTRSMGPSGVVRLFSREVMMRPILAEGAGAVRYFDEFNITAKGRAVRESGGCVLIGAVRYEVAGETNFGVEFSTETAKALKPLIGGDMQRVQEIISNNTGAVGDRLRTIMFGGDNYIEASTMQALNAKAYAKIWASIETPYGMTVL